MWGTKSMKYRMVLLASLGFFSVLNTANAAIPTLEISAASGDTSTTGPTTSSQANTYQFNPDNPTADTFTNAYFPKTTVTYSFVTQQYSNGMVFGSNNTSNGNNRVFIPLVAQGAPTNSDFSSSRFNIGTGIDVNQNYGTRLAVDAYKLNTKNIQTSGLGHYFGILKVDFSRPVKNPVINVSGLGGSASYTIGFLFPKSVKYGITTNLKLSNPPAGVSIRALSGQNLAVRNATEIVNTATRYGPTTGGSNNASYDLTGPNGGASGSIQVDTTQAITSLSFEVYLATDYTGNETEWLNGTSDAFVFSAASIDSMVGDLVVSKTNSTTQVYSGGTTTYTVRVSNNGPDTYTGTLLKDVVGTGLTATAVACSEAPGNKCSTAPALNSLASVDTGSLASGE